MLYLCELMFMGDMSWWVKKYFLIYGYLVFPSWFVENNIISHLIISFSPAFFFNLFLTSFSFLCSFAFTCVYSKKHIVTVFERLRNNFYEVLWICNTPAHKHTFWEFVFFSVKLARIPFLTHVRLFILWLNFCFPIACLLTLEWIMVGNRQPI